MSLREFIKLEADALRLIQGKDASMTFKAVECGAMEKVRLYAESRNYQVSLTEIVDIILNELCYNG
jgi:hypothetical protein